MTFYRLALALCLLGVSRHALAAPIAVDAFTFNDDAVHSLGAIVTMGDFEIVASMLPIYSNEPDLAAVGRLRPDAAPSPALYNHNALGITTIKRMDDGAFDFFSLELIELPMTIAGVPVDLGIGGVSFAAQFIDGTTEICESAFDPFPAITTVTCPTFRNLHSFSWVQGAGGTGAPTHQFANVNVAAVPEPATATLVTIGALLAWRRRPS